MKNKNIVIADIQSSSSLEMSQLKDYKYIEKKNNSWLYMPVIVRFENETYIQSWNYFVNEESTVLTSEMNTWGESKFSNYEECVYCCDNKKDIEALEEVVKIIHSNLKFFKDPFLKKESSEILKIYSLEIIKQRQDYRVRIRPVLGQKIIYDFYYCTSDNHLKINKNDSIK